MKCFLISVGFLLSISALGLEQDGFVKNVVADDEGIKLILTRTLDSTNVKDISTVHISNQQENFVALKRTISERKENQQPVSIKKDSKNIVTVK